MSKASHLHEKLPREQAGAQTGRKYEYQYELAAYESLRLLTDKPAPKCIFCEWHDDFVVELDTPPTALDFHQVKTRTLSQGPWTIANVFGLGRRNSQAPAKDDCIAARLLEHQQSFPTSCRSLCLVTNHAANTDFRAFVEAVANSSALPSDLPKPHQKTYKRIKQAYSKHNLTPGEFARFIRSIRICDEEPPYETADPNQHKIAHRVSELSEVDILWTEANQIAIDLVSLARRKSHTRLDVLPTTIDKLRDTKGIVTDDVLSVLSLSPEGYRALKANGKDGVRQLSQLQRLCRDSGIPDDLVPHLCTCKSAWDVWLRQERNTVSEIDLLALRQDASALLKAHLAHNRTLDALARECADLARKHQNIGSNSSLTQDVVFGCALAFAAEARSSS